MRWEHEAKMAAEHLGWTVVESDGVSDYQGWGVLLLQRDSQYVDPYAAVIPTEWGVLSWAYGSCSYCDPYEEEFYSHDDPDPITDRGSPEHCARVFGDLIGVCKTEEDARLAYDSAKGW